MGFASLPTLGDPPNGEDQGLTKSNEDERTVSTTNSFADDASLNRRIQARLTSFQAVDGSTPATDLFRNVDQNSLWSGCTGCTGDDTLSLTHAYRVMLEEIECVFNGSGGEHYLTNGMSLPYVCWPNDDDSDMSSIDKDDRSKSSDKSGSGKDDLTKESSGIQDDSVVQDSSSANRGSSKDILEDVQDDSSKERSDEKEETASTSSKPKEKLSKSVFFWRASSKDKITTRSIDRKPEFTKAPVIDPESLEDPELEQLVKDIITPPALKRELSIPETVNTALSHSNHQGIETEDLSDDDSKSGDDDDDDDDDSQGNYEENGVEVEAPTPKDIDSAPSDKSSRSKRAILGRMKRAFSKSSLSRHSVGSKSSKPNVQAREGSTIGTLPPSTTGSLSRHSVGSKSSKPKEQAQDEEAIDTPSPSTTSSFSKSSEANEQAQDTTPPSTTSSLSRHSVGSKSSKPKEQAQDEEAIDTPSPSTTGSLSRHSVGSKNSNAKEQAQDEKAIDTPSPSTTVSLSRHSVGSKSSKLEDRTQDEDDVDTPKPSTTPEVLVPAVVNAIDSETSDNESLSGHAVSKSTDGAQESTEAYVDKTADTEANETLVKELVTVISPSSVPGSNRDASAIAEADTSEIPPADEMATGKETLSKPSILTRVKRSVGMKDRSSVAKSSEHETATVEASQEKSTYVAGTHTRSTSEQAKESLPAAKKEDPIGCTAYLVETVNSTETASGVESEKSHTDATAEELESVELAIAPSTKKEADAASVHSGASENLFFGLSYSRSEEEESLLNPIILDRVRRSFAGLLQMNSESKEESIIKVDEPETSKEVQADLISAEKVASKDQVESQVQESTEKEANVETAQEPDTQTASSIINKSVEETTKVDTDKPGTPSSEEDSSVDSASSVGDVNSSAIDNASLQNSISLSRGNGLEHWYDDSGVLLCQCSSAAKNIEPKIKAKDETNEQALSSLPETSEVQGGDLSARDLSTIAPATSEVGMTDQGILVKIRSSVQGGLLLRLFVESDECKGNAKNENKDESVYATEPINLHESSDIHCDAVSISGVSISGVSISETTVVTNNTRVASAQQEPMDGETSTEKTAEIEEIPTDEGLDSVKSTKTNQEEESVEVPLSDLENANSSSKPSILQRVKRSIAKTSDRSVVSKHSNSDIEEIDEINETATSTVDTELSTLQEPSKEEDEGISTSVITPARKAEEDTKDERTNDTEEQSPATKDSASEAASKSVDVLEAATEDEESTAAASTKKETDKSPVLPSPGREVDSKKQSRISKIKEMMENAPEEDDSDEEFVSECVDTIGVASSSTKETKPISSPSKKIPLAPVGLPPLLPYGRKSSNKKRSRISRLKRSIRKLGKPKSGE